MTTVVGGNRCAWQNFTASQVLSKLRASSALFVHVFSL